MQPTDGPCLGEAAVEGQALLLLQSPIFAQQVLLLCTQAFWLFSVVCICHREAVKALLCRMLYLYAVLLALPLFHCSLCCVCRYPCLPHPTGPW
jgi:hypothetical protein